MLLFYIRHGEPIYSPDSLTPTGEKQAEALSIRLAAYGLDRIYASSSNRAILTAKPTCERLRMEPTILDWANEKHAAKDFFLREGSRDAWIYVHPCFCEKLHDPEVRALGDRWYEHPMFSDYPNFKSGIERVAKETDALLEEWGYRHDRAHGYYIETRKNEERVALFAHEGFGKLFLSQLLDIPYPTFSTLFELRHSSMTVIWLRANPNGIVIPRVLTGSNDSHLWSEDLNSHYNNIADVQF